MIIPVTQLERYPHNPRNISGEKFAELKDRIVLKKQYKPLIVTPSDSEGKYIVLGGNMRLRALIELGLESAVCTLIEFYQDDNQIWRTKVNGQLTEERFERKEVGMMDWNLADNDEFGYTDATLFANEMSAFPEIDLSKHSVVFEEVQSISDFIKEIAPDEDETKPDAGEHLVECPECKATFDPSKNRVLTEGISET